MIKYLARRAIRAYQKHISPHKGYGCAHRVYGGSKTGCSGHALKLLDRFNFALAMRLLRRRFDRCAWHAAEERKRFAFAKHQQGMVDCGGCDAPACDTPSCELPSCDMHVPNCNVFECGSAPEAGAAGAGEHGFVHRACSFFDFLNICDCGNGCNSNTNSNTNSSNAAPSSRGAEREEARRNRRREHAKNKNQQDEPEHHDYTHDSGEEL